MAAEKEQTISTWKLEIESKLFSDGEMEQAISWWMLEKESKLFSDGSWKKGAGYFQMEVGERKQTILCSRCRDLSRQLSRDSARSVQSGGKKRSASPRPPLSQTGSADTVSTGGEGMESTWEFCEDCLVHVLQ
ncbi:hypothetical protein FQA47_025445 [Oryzias melastigma]|uniref:Uncharacterized protein n=1 Tax=Oryzias melastigma TaxID=30732 RepID=A0A834C197_ORYME|nr:hypothetical protein FQA47_025445 [Oryzias melastigma]